MLCSNEKGQEEEVILYCYDKMIVHMIPCYNTNSSNQLSGSFPIVLSKLEAFNATMVLMSDTAQVETVSSGLIHLQLLHSTLNAVRNSRDGNMEEMADLRRRSPEPLSFSAVGKGMRTLFTGMSLMLSSCRVSLGTRSCGVTLHLSFLIDEPNVYTSTPLHLYHSSTSSLTVNNFYKLQYTFPQYVSSQGTNRFRTIVW